MTLGDTLIGRKVERSILEAQVDRALRGRGSIVLLGGEAGIGKTTLARRVLEEAGLDRLEGFGVQEGGMAYGPIFDVLRSLARTRAEPGLPDAALSRALDALRPKHGTPERPVDSASLFDTIGSALAAAAAHGPLAILLDDMHWADEATLGLLPVLARALDAVPVLLLVAYRDDEVPREHPIRRLRAELRRDQRLCEVSLEPMDGEDTAALLEHVLGRPPAASLLEVMIARTGGVPFFVAELGAALAANARLHQDADGLELAASEDLPLPESVRDAVLLRASGLAPEARRVLAVAAVTGQAFEMEFAMAIAEIDSWPDALLDSGAVIERAPGQMAFRHALVREAFYDEVPWPQRRTLHRQVAQRLEADGAPARTIAEHWVLAREPEAARRSFLAVVDACCSVHAYRDGAHAARRALQLSVDDEHIRVGVLERLAACAELAGDAGEAAAAWREIAQSCRQTEPWRSGEAWGRQAGALELQGRWEEALVSREAAAAAFAGAGAAGEAAAQRLAAAAHLRSAASFTASLRFLELAGHDAAAAQRLDLQVRIQALEGNVRARMGDAERGIELVRGALTAALSENLSAAAAEIYQRLADSLEHRGDYGAARATYDDAAAFCHANGAEPMAQLCFACLAVVLRQAGDWPRAVDVAREVIDSPASIPHARAAGACTLGVILALRGDVDQARALLLDASSLARRIELLAAELIAAWGLAILDQVRQHPERAVEGCHFILRRWEQTEERHYSISPLRWASSLLAEAGDPAGARACAAALARIAADAGQPEAMSALAHALGETAMLDGNPEQAVLQFERAIGLLQSVGAPFERMESERRAAVALRQVGRREDAIERLSTAYRLARRLRLRPSIQRLAANLAELGERVDRRLSRQQAEQLVQEQLTRREIEVIRLLAVGATNREMATELFLSVRTIDTHVRNILRKLDCRSRADAARRATELGLLATADR